MLYSLEDIKIYIDSQGSYPALMNGLKNIDKIVAQERKLGKIKEEEELRNNATINLDSKLPGRIITEDEYYYPGNRFMPPDIGLI